MMKKTNIWKNWWTYIKDISKVLLVFYKAYGVYQAESEIIVYDHKWITNYCIKIKRKNNFFFAFVYYSEKYHQLMPASFVFMTILHRFSADNSRSNFSRNIFTTVVSLLKNELVVWVYGIYYSKFVHCSNMLMFLNPDNGVIFSSFFFVI